MPTRNAPSRGADHLDPAQPGARLSLVGTQHALQFFQHRVQVARQHTGVVQAGQSWCIVSSAWISFSLNQAKP